MIPINPAVVIPAMLAFSVPYPNTPCVINHVAAPGIAERIGLLIMISFDYYNKKVLLYIYEPLLSVAHSLTNQKITTTK